MLFGAKVLALVAAVSSVTFAAPTSDAIPEAFDLTKRNCPRCEPFGGAKAIAGLYLGLGNNKCNQIERLIEEAIELCVGEHPKCEKKDIYVYCEEDGEHWGQKRDQVEKRTDYGNDNNGNNGNHGNGNNGNHGNGNNGNGNGNQCKCKDCDKEYPYKHCYVKCKTHDYC